MEEKDLALIDRYLNREATPQELEEVQQRMAKDQAFARQVSMVREMNVALSPSSQEFQKQLQEAMEVVDRQERAGWPVWRYAVAAGVAVLIAVGLYFSLKPADPNYAQLAENTFTPPQSPFLVRDSSNANQPLLLGAEAYERGDYIEAIRQWQQVNDENPRKDEANLYLGISWLANGDGSKATEMLVPLVQHPRPEISQSAAWYLALSWLSLDQPDQATSLLDSLSAGGGSMGLRAQQLLDQMN